MAVATTIGQRFLQLVQHLGISKNAFAQSLEKTATVIQHLVDERNKPGYDLLCKVFKVYPHVSKDWLLLGQGPMLTAGSAATAVAESAGMPTLFTVASVPPAAAAKVSEAASLPLPAPIPESEASSEEATVAQAPESEPTPAKLIIASEPPVNPTIPAPPISTGVTEAMLTAALHAQHLQHQLALAEQRNQHLLEQQRLMQQLLDFAQRR